MVEIDNITLYEILALTITVIISPLLVIVWRLSRQLTMMQDQISHLQKSEESGEKAHDKLEEKIDHITSTLIKISERLARIEGGRYNHHHHKS